MVEIFGHNYGFCTFCNCALGYETVHVSLSLVAVSNSFRSPKRPDRDTDISGITSSSGLHAVSGASTGAPPQQKTSSLFDSIDTQRLWQHHPIPVRAGFPDEKAFHRLSKFGSGGDLCFARSQWCRQLSKQDFVSTMSGLMASLCADPSHNRPRRRLIR